MRQIAEIPIEQIVVVNPRERDPAKFKDNVDSIARVGLKRPIVVNTRFLEDSGKYDLVCGQGRLEAVKRLGWTLVPALIIDVDRPTALMMSIAENAARHSPPPIWFANVVKGLHDSGMKIAEIAVIIGKTTESVSQYLKLVTQGEECLIQAVEQGKISASLAMEIAHTPDKEQQILLLNAYQQGEISSGDMRTVRHMIEMRQKFGIRIQKTGTGKCQTIKTIEDMRKEVKRSLVKQEEFVKKSQRAENRLMLLAEELSRLKEDPLWIEIVRAEGLTNFPKLKGELFVQLFDHKYLEEL